MPASLEGFALPSAGSITLAIKAFFHPEKARGVNETFELHLGKEVLQVLVRDGGILVQQGQTFKADTIFFTRMDVFVGLFAGQINPEEAIAEGLVRVEGDSGALNRFLSLSGVRGAGQ